MTLLPSVRCSRCPSGLRIVGAFARLDTSKGQPKGREYHARYKYNYGIFHAACMKIRVRSLIGNIPHGMSCRNGFPQLFVSPQSWGAFHRVFPPPIITLCAYPVPPESVHVSAKLLAPWRHARTTGVQ